jgi:hypothetical protein
MKKPTLEERVAQLEAQVAELRAALKNGPQAQGWQSTVGMFTGNESMKRIVEAGRKWREAERRKARRAPRSTRQAKT